MSFTVDDLLILQDKQQIDEFVKPELFFVNLNKWLNTSRENKQKLFAKYIDFIKIEKKDKEINKNRLNELNNKADNLQNKSLQITNIIDNLKSNNLNENNYSISNNEINEIKDYIKQTQDTTTNLKTTNDLTTILEHYENDLKNHSKEVKNLQQRNKNRDNRIDELEDKVSKLEETFE